MNELAYANYIQRARKADCIYKTIKEIYSYDSNTVTSYDPKLLLKALRDKIITNEEYILLKEFK